MKERKGQRCKEEEDSPPPLQRVSQKETAHGKNCNKSLIVTCIYNRQAGKAGKARQGRHRQAGKKRNRQADKLRSTNFL